MRDVTPMRTTLDVDEDVLLAVKELARLRRSTAGRVLSDLARSALRQPDDDQAAIRNGVPLLPPRPDEGVVTPEVVDRLRDDA